MLRQKYEHIFKNTFLFPNHVTNLVIATIDYLFLGIYLTTNLFFIFSLYVYTKPVNCKLKILHWNVSILKLVE